MSYLKIYTTNPEYISAANFSPRNYDPVYLFVKERLKDGLNLEQFLVDSVRGGSTPPQYLFKREGEGIPFVKTSAIDRDFVNINDLHFIHPNFHYEAIARSIARPFDVIYSMTGKFMGKACLAPPTLQEVNMSQNSVVLKTDSPERSAFLTIFLNSDINRKQIAGLYSITKQKYINQGKIAKLKLIDYKGTYGKFVSDYLDGINSYYDSIEKIKTTIRSFNQVAATPPEPYDSKYEFTLSPNLLDKKILTAQYYRSDFRSALKAIPEDPARPKLRDFEITKGSEIGSDNYEFEGIPFIKTSDFLNYGVDYQPNYYCSEAIHSECEQDLRQGDILFTKDGKIGETAILEESARVVISAGIVRIRPTSDETRYWLFLLLSSNYGQLFFRKWNVIASTMAHLRKDFFSDFRFPNIKASTKMDYITNLSVAFRGKKRASEQIGVAKNKLLAKILQDYHVTPSLT
jgi:type I restriction enzyme S subunit